VSIAGIGPGAIPAVPVTQVRATIRAALMSATGDAAESGLVSASVASLVRRISMAMFWQQMRGVIGVALAAVFAIIGAGLLVRAAVVPRVPAPARSSQPAVKPLVGVVRGPDDRPVAGATVVAGQFQRKPNHLIGTTGPDGRFELTPGGDSSILQFVMAYKEGFAPASVMGIASGHPVPLEGEVMIQLTRPVPFVGLVKDGQGQPIAGAVVRIRNVQYPGEGGKPIGLNVLKGVLSGTPLEPMFQTTTDVQGRFRFPNLPRKSELWLVVTAAGMGEYNTRNHKRRDDGFGHHGTTEAPAQIILAPAARAVGRVVTRFRSVKVAGLKVGLQGSQGSRSIGGVARTDADGRFEFDGLDEGTANVYLMDHPNDGPWTYRAAADTELKPGRTTEVQIELIRGLQVEGQVVDGDSRAPVAGVGVGLYGPIRPRSGAAIVSATTDKEGRYRFRLPPGETFFYICGPVPAEYGPRATAARTVEIPADAREFTVPSIELRKPRPGQ
jgi:Carboxypeptidase regulatory-like domain